MEKKYINVIYFDDFDDDKEISSNQNAFKKITNGAFIFRRRDDGFSCLMKKIKNKSKENSKNNIFFHLIVSGKKVDAALKIIDENGTKQNIKKICIYCSNPKVIINKYQNNNYIEKDNITKKKKNVIKFIEDNKSEEISPLKEEEFIDEKLNFEDQNIVKQMNPSLHSNLDDDENKFDDFYSNDNSTWNPTGY